MSLDENKEPGLNRRQKMVVVVMDLLLLAELTFSIYAGQRDPEYVTAVFLRTFLPMALTTLITARILLKKLRAPEPLDLDPAAEAVESRGSL